ncbi:MAG: glycosyltransferase, partial [Gammaproteobacteria bacterium]|nr:glycosyltransferase [Gammaproteobacteria bacterium]
MLKNILLRGELGDNQSCGIVNIGLCYGFERNGVNVSIDPKSLYGQIPKYAYERIGRKLPFDVVVEHGLPYQMQGLGKNRPWKRIALNFWDSSLITKEAADCLNEYADQIIVHSEFNRKGLLDAGVEKEVIVGGYAVFTELYRNIVKKQKDKFRFVFTGVAQGRKGVQEAISGFEEALGDKDDVEFVIKSNSWGKLSDYTVKCKNVLRVYEEFPRGKLIEFMANADAYICLSKGDGFHGGGCEAM